jgi:magnesium-transporting ATPase (P-type)
VPQGNTVFSGTIADNLRLVKGDATDEEIEIALKIADAWDFVSVLPLGINTVVGERGVNFSEGQVQRLSIARAVLYGRTIFHSIRKFIVFQLTMNFCAVCVSFIGPFIGIEMPVTVTQMLWINIIMDTLAGLAFAGEAPQKSYMEEKPKSRREPIITGSMVCQILITGAYTVVLLTAFLVMPFFRERYGFEENFVGFMTAFFCLFVFCGVCNAFNARTSRIKLFAYIARNKGFLFIMLLICAVQILLVFFGGTMFRTCALPWRVLSEVALLGFSVIPFDLMRKVFQRIFSMGK